jgi:hypothetical protein
MQQQPSAPALGLKTMPAFNSMHLPANFYTSYGNISSVCKALACQGVTPPPSEAAAAAAAAAAKATMASSVPQIPMQPYHPILHPPQAPPAPTDSCGSKRRRLNESPASVSQQSLSGAGGGDDGPRGGLFFIDRYLGGTTGHSSREGRCAVCLVQRKGRCGTKSAPQTCLRVQAYQAKNLEVPDAPPKMVRRRENDPLSGSQMHVPLPPQLLQFAPRSPVQ